MTIFFVFVTGVCKIYQIIIMYLQKKAEEAHNMFAKLGPKIDLVCVKLVRESGLLCASVY